MGGTPLFCLGRLGPPAEHFADEVGLQASSAGGAETPKAEQRARRSRGYGSANFRRYQFNSVKALKGS